MFPQNEERFNRLQELSPFEAVQTWLNGDFVIGDEDALIVAIRRDTRIKLYADDIIDIMLGAMEDRLDAQTCLKRLTVEQYN